MASETLKEYMNALEDCSRLYYPNISHDDTIDAIRYSIKKRYKSVTGSIDNNYTRERVNKTILEISDYIKEKQPCITAYGVLFQKHGAVPNPLKNIIEQFLNARGVHKKQMFQYPKGSEMFEYYNLLQTLTY